MDAAAKLLVAGGEDGTLRYTNPQSANVDDKRVTEAHAGPVTAVAIDTSGPTASLDYSCASRGTAEIPPWQHFAHPAVLDDLFKVASGDRARKTLPRSDFRSSRHKAHD